MKIFYIFLISLFLSCSATPSQKQLSMESYTKRYEAFDVILVWNSIIDNNQFSVDGLVKNNYVYKIRNLEITARGIDNNGNIVCISNFDFFPEELMPQEVKPFKIQAKCKDKVSKITFFYRHYFAGDKDMRDLNFGSFE